MCNLILKGVWVKKIEPSPCLLALKFQHLLTNKFKNFSRRNLIHPVFSSRKRASVSKTRLNQQSQISVEVEMAYSENAVQKLSLPYQKRKFNYPMQEANHRFLNCFKIWHLIWIEHIILQKQICNLLQQKLLNSLLESI